MAKMTIGIIKRKSQMKRKKTEKREYDFALVLDGIAQLTVEMENALFEGGCDDATISVRFGRVFLTFSRTATSFKEAILSAIRDVKKAKIGAEVLRIDVGNLVTQADIARHIGRSRQLVHQYLTGARGPGGFPSPACAITDGAPLWYWSEVAYWLWQNDMIQEDVLQKAQEVALINSALELQHQCDRNPVLTEEVLRETGFSRILA
jgi:hypothetical protein